ncbi:hypothetical protein JL720_3065 [Aureococcus anophagefferens]|nr:hypothetical protein JL720_3065 [Aureococcus anophagefferens]
MSVFALDVDGDGDQDGLSASELDDTVAWYENDGSQSFAERVVTTLADGTQYTFATDVDGDGDTDVLLASLDDDTVAWHENDGSQGFTEHVLTTAADGARTAYAIDVDGDSDVDVLSTSIWDDTVAWYENDGSQSFTEQVITTAADWAADGFALDVDGDGDVDVLSAAITATADGAYSVFAIDVDGDGDVDVLSSSVTDDTVAWYENDCGTLVPTRGAVREPRATASPKPTLSPAPTPRPTVFCTSVAFTERIITTLADGARTVFAIDVDGDGDACCAFALDVDGDGDVDVLSASHVDATVAWYENDGAQSFSQRVITATADGAYSVVAIDVDGDGDVDVLSASTNDDTVAWYENDGSQSFAERIITTLSDHAFSIFAIDVDGDGDVDALSASPNDDTIAWYENDGSESFTKHVISNAADGAYTAFAIDVDGDGDVDALSASANDDTVAWYENDGSESFTERIISNSADGAMSVFALDVDGDGDVDVLSASQDDDTIAWYENDGSQSFAERVVTTLADGTQYTFAIDVDGDGDTDVLSTSLDDDTVAWFENDCATLAPTLAPTLSPAPTVTPRPTYVSHPTLVAYYSFDDGTAADNYGILDGTLNNCTRRRLQKAPFGDDASDDATDDATTRGPSTAAPAASGSDGGSSDTPGPSTAAPAASSSECRGPTACDCSSDEFCNFDDGSSGGCESCASFSSTAACGEDGLPSDGEDDCVACCFGSDDDATAGGSSDTPGPSTAAPTASPACNSWAGRDGRGALAFDGVDQFARLPAAVTADIQGSSARTVCLWAAIDSFAAATVDYGGALFDYGNTATLGDFTLRVFGTDGSLRVDFWGSWVDVALAGSDDGDWHHYCLTYDGSDWALYFDGSQAETGTAALDTGATRALELGRWGGITSYLDGAVDEVYVYSSALDAADVQVLYDAVTVAPTLPTPSPTLHPSTAGYRLAGVHWVHRPSGALEGARTNATFWLDTWADEMVTPRRAEPAGAVELALRDGDGAGWGATSTRSVSALRTFYGPTAEVVVSVAPVDDAAGTGDRAVALSLTLASFDPNYDGGRFDEAWNFTIVEDDAPGLVIATATATYAAGDALALADGERNGAAASFFVSLGSEPAGATVVTCAVDGSFVAAAPASWTVEDWDAPVEVEVALAAADDADVTGDRVAAVSCSTASEDAAYDGLAGAAVSFAVHDDDVAAVLVTAAVVTVGANAGGPVFADAYGLALSSRPAAPVVVFLEPSAGVAANVDNVTFLPDEWDAEVTIEVAAALLDDDDGGRSGLVAHVAASDDPAYGGIAVDAVAVDVAFRVAFTADSEPPPKVVAAVFFDGGQGLTVSLDRACDRGGASANPSPATPSDAGPWGDGSRARGALTRAVAVTFGSAATAVPYDFVANRSALDTVSLRGSVLRNAANGTLYAAAQSFDLARPADPVAPALAVSAPDAVGLCDGLDLDASGATGGGSRALAYAWSLVDAADAHAALAARLAAETGTRVSLAWDDLVPGETLGFAATATNYLGESTTSDVKYVAKVGSPTPKVMFQTSTTTIRRSDALTLKLDVSLPSTNCTDGNVTGALGYAWIARKWDGDLEHPGWGSALPELDDETLAVYARNPSALRLPADALEAGEVYAFGVTTQDLEAAIAGGVERYVAAASVVSLDASASADPDNATADGPLRFSWNLTRADDGADLTANASLGDAAVVEFVADVAPGTYVAAVTGATAPSPMLLDLGLVTPGDTYFFRLSATDGSGASSSAVVQVDVNAPPTSGSFAVSPRRGGFAVSTTYEFALSDWSDDADDYPLTYAFAYEDLGRDVLLVADRYATSWLATTLPKTGAANVTCSGTVYDRLLASATGSQATEVLVAAYAAAELAALADDAVGAALDAGDSESALREISSISSVIAAGGDDDANTDLVSTLMAATLSAFDGVDAAASPEATAQVLGTMATLVANPGLLAPEVQMDAVGLLGTTVSNAVAAGLDGAASTSTAAALSSVLSASLFEDGGSARRRRLKAHASLDVAPNSTLARKLRRRRLAARRRLDEGDGEANTTLADDMTTTSSSTSSDNLAIDAWRTDCGTRSSSFGTGGGTAFAPPASATGACGDDAGDDGAGSDVDVQIAEMSNVYGEPEAKRGEEKEEVKSKLVQVEMSDTGDDGRRRRLTAFGDDDPITLVIQFQEPDFARRGPDPQVVTFPDGSNGTFYAPPLGAAPLDVSATCPSKAPLCTFWDDTSQAWSGANCTVAKFTAFNVTCACTHLTDFAGGASSTASTASAVVSTGASLSLSQLLDALLVLIVLLAVGGGFLFGCVRAHQLDEEDEVRGKYTRDHHAHEAGVKASGPLELTGNKASFLAAAKRARTHRGWISRRSARESTTGLGRPDQTLKLSRSAEPGVYAPYADYVRPRLPASLAVVASFVTAIRREHKLLQIAYLPDPALSRATRVALLAVLIFAALFANAFLVTLAPVETSKPPWHEDVLVPKMYFSALTTILINVFYLSLGALRGARRAHPSTGGSSPRRATAPRTRAPSAHAERRVYADDLRRREEDAAELHLRTAHLAGVARYAARRREARRIAVDDALDALTLDEQAPYVAEEEELAKMPWYYRALYQDHLSPLKDALAMGRRPRRALPRWCATAAFLRWCATSRRMWYVFMFSVLLNECSQCDQDEATETCVAPEDGVCNCGDNESLYAYCGGGSADAASLSWLEMCLVSVALSVFLTGPLAILAAKSALPLAARAVIGADSLAHEVLRAEHGGGAAAVAGRGERPQTKRLAKVVPVDNDYGDECKEPPASPRLSAAFDCPCGARVALDRRPFHLASCCPVFRDSWAAAGRGLLEALGRDAVATPSPLAVERSVGERAAFCALADFYGSTLGLDLALVRLEETGDARVCVVAVSGLSEAVEFAGRGAPYELAAIDGAPPPAALADVGAALRRAPRPVTLTLAARAPPSPPPRPPRTRPPSRRTRPPPRRTRPPPRRPSTSAASLGPARPRTAEERVLRESLDGLEAHLRACEEACGRMRRVVDAADAAGRDEARSSLAQLDEAVARRGPAAEEPAAEEPAAAAEEPPPVVVDVGGFSVADDDAPVSDEERALAETLDRLEAHLRACEEACGRMRRVVDAADADGGDEARSSLAQVEMIRRMAAENVRGAKAKLDEARARRAA